MARLLSRVAGSLAAVAVVTLLVYALRPIAPVLSLGVLYTLAVLATAVLWGLTLAIVVAFVSMATFNFAFLAPVHTFSLAESRNWVALGVYLTTAVVASELATRARRRAREAAQREREAGLLADAAASLLRDETPAEIRARAERILSDGDAIARRRFDAALESLVALAEERERIAELRRSDTIKTAVLRSVSHDFRTPLATIAASLEGLENTELSLTDADRAVLFETMRLEVDRLLKLVGNLLDLSRLQLGAAAPHAALWPVEELLVRAVDEVSRPDRLDVRIGRDTPPAVVDDTQIQRVIVNLLDNALKFSTGRVLVDAHGEGEGLVVVEVSDEGGAGAPGAGLGLSIARGFAEVNGARVEIEPRASGGTVARLVLPAGRVPAGVTS
jgi:two-component system sensor histidine kinase KdpD